MKIKIFLLFVILFICISLNAQNYLISSGVGHSYFINKNAGGYNINLSVDKKLSPKGYISVEVGHSFNDKTPFGRNLSDEKILIRDFTNRSPLGSSSWNRDDSWPKIRLQSQPERFFRLDFILNYRQEYKAWTKSKLKFNIGGVLSYRDEMELTRLIPIQEIGFSSFGGVLAYDQIIPIFSYNTFLDLGLNLGHTYSLTINENLDVALNTQFVYYPKSSHVMWNNGIKLIIKR